LLGHWTLPSFLLCLRAATRNRVCDGALTSMDTRGTNCCGLGTAFRNMLCPECPPRGRSRQERMFVYPLRFRGATCGSHLVHRLPSNPRDAEVLAWGTTEYPA
jgi:hypothetical protein